MLLQTRVIPLVVSLGLHALVAILLLWDFPQLTSKPPPPPRPIVQAKIMSLQQAAPAPAPAPAPRPAPRPDAEAKRQEAARAEQRRLEQQRIETQKREQQKKKEEAERQAREKQLAEQKRLEEKRQQEKRLEEQRQRELQHQRELLAQSAAEEEARMLADRDSALVASFTSVIERTIIANWSRPASARNNMQAELLIQLVPTGEVVSVTIARSSGNAAFDRSAENAVLRAGRFPELQEMPNRVFEQNFRRFRLIFRPEDLRR